jgi:NADPH2:quinone reductase
MRAVVVKEWTEPSALAIGEIPEPALEPGSVLIDVKAAGCNYFDTLIVRGRYQVKPPFPFSPGGEVAGIVREVADDVSHIASGDPVMAYVGHGGFAEVVCAPARATHRLPESMSFEEAAAFPIVYGTAHLSVARRGMLEPGETLLVTAAAGGVGLASIQVGRALGARVIALARGPEKLQIALDAGADVAIDYADENWVAQVEDASAGRGADVIIENVGGEIFEGCTRCIAWAGRLVVVGFASGDIPSIRANRILLKHISLVGVHWGPMIDHEPEVLAETYRSLFELYESKKLSPIIWKRFSLEEVPQALGAIESRGTWGKLVISL